MFSLGMGPPACKPFEVSMSDAALARRNLPCRLMLVKLGKWGRDLRRHLVSMGCRGLESGGGSAGVAPEWRRRRRGGFSSYEEHMQ
jgi:hypothetical protein